MKSTLNQCFTPKKLHQMFPLVNNVALRIPKMLQSQIEDTKVHEFEFQSLASKYACDVIATCAYGVEVNSIKAPENIFSQLADTFEHIISIKNFFKIIGFVLVPQVMKVLRIKLLGNKFKELFSDSIFELMKIRQENQIFRPDLVNLLMEVKAKQLKSPAGTKIWSDEILSAQSLAFFLGGSATISSSVAFTAYEIACNQEVQNKLFNEVLDLHESLGERDLTYADINGMKYMDQVICESLRLWPSSPLTGRSCSKPFDLKVDGKNLHFDENLDFLVPILSIHRSKEYFTDPDVFDPERFNEENRRTMNSDAYIPFGSGPRQCIGVKFSLMELKVIFFYLLLQFEINVSDKTSVPLVLEKNPLQLKAKGGIWINLHKRGY